MGLIADESCDGLTRVLDPVRLGFCVYFVVRYAFLGRTS